MQDGKSAAARFLFLHEAKYKYGQLAIYNKTSYRSTSARGGQHLI
jgi:hypothetical protein